MPEVELDARTVGMVALGALALIQTARLAWRSTARRWALSRIRARARRGERDAERLLAREGYRVTARQARARVTYRVDGDPRTVEVVADLLVTRAGRTYVAEVKTGARAPDPTHRSTRRQLLEYGHAFEADGVLLVDAEAGRVHRVGLPRRDARASPWIAIAAGFAAGAAVGWLLFGA